MNAASFEAVRMTQQDRLLFWEDEHRSMRLAALFDSHRSATGCRVPANATLLLPSA